MATMIPSTPREFDSYSMEDIMFDALKKLPDSYYVFHSFKILTIENGIIRESETDFIIFHQNKGVLCLEAKAGIPLYKNGEWYYQSGIVMNHGGPYRQAQNNVHKLVDYMRKHDMEGIINSCKFVHGVWFPSVRKNQIDNIHFPSESEKKLTLTNENLDNIQSGIDRIFAFDVTFGRITTSLEDYQVKKLFDDVLCPSFNIVPSMKAENLLNKKIFNRLLNEQVKILNYLEDQPSAVINGIAGSGKTMIALEKARRDSVDGSRVLFLCFNRYLKDYLSSNFANPYIDFYTIDGYALKLCKGKKDSFNHAIDELIVQYESGDFPYKHIIIDEGQDFGQDRIEESNIIDTLRMIVLDESIDGTFYVFYDKLQLIQGHIIPDYISDADCKLTLYKNCRNTENIANTSLRPFDKFKKPRLFEAAIKGVVPSVYFADNAEKTKEAVDCCIRQLVADGMESIVLLTCSSRSEKSIFYKYVTDDKYRIGSKELLFTTVRKFKGLEADAIILIDIVRETLKRNYANIFYVGASRARFQLMMISNMTENECGESLEEFEKNPGKKPEKVLAAFLGAKYHKL